MWQRCVSFHLLETVFFVFVFIILLVVWLDVTVCMYLCMSYLACYRWVQRYNSCLLASLSNSYHLQIKIVDVFAQALVSEIKSYKPQYNTILRYIPIWEKIFRDKSACVFFTVRCICTCVCIIYSVELYFCYVCLHIFGCWIPIGVILTRLVCPSYYFGITKI